MYKVLMDSADAGKLLGGQPKSEAKRWIWATIVVTLIALLSVVYHVYKHISQPEYEAASIEKMAFPLPQKPSIAVLPFTNMSGDPEQDFFSDGLTEEIITALSKVPKLFIIARNSVFTYKGKPIKVNQVAEELGVKYVLEGSVKKSGNQVRITAQLIDALSGHYLWSERYNRNLNDIFAIYDEIALKIIIAMEVVLTKGEKARLITIGTESIDAYLKLLQGIERFVRLNSVDNAAARKLFQEAISIDPNSSIPYAYEARTHWTDYWLRFSESPSDSIRQGFETVQKAIALDGALPIAHSSLARFYLLNRQHQKALQKARKGIDLQPNSSDGHALMGQILTFSGKPEEAIIHHKMSIRLDPFAPSQYYHLLGMAYREAGRYDEAIEACKEAITRQPNNMFAHLILAATYSMTNKMEEAEAQKKEVLRINPNFTLERLSQVRPHIDPQNTARFISSLRIAGLPDKKPLPLPDKPSIAVLAFDNLSGDPSQEYFSDGISEEIITALSKTDQLFVIARNSSFTYKGKPVKIKQVSEELGVRYVLEGSVRKIEDRVRINAQLIDAAKGHHLWAERYDSDIKNIFALQDEITMKIVTALQIELTEGEQARMAIKRHKNLDVKLKVMEATSLWRKGTKKSFIRYGQMAQEIIDLVPDYQWGYRHLAWYNWILAMKGKSPQESIAKAFKLAQKALSLDESDPFSHALLGSVYLAKRQYEKAIAAGKRSVELEPNGAMVHAILGSTLGYAGKLDEAIGHLNQGVRLNPYPPYWYYLHLGRCYRQKGQYEEALIAFKKAYHLSPDSVFNNMALASIYVLLDRQEKAEAAAKKVLELKPRFSIKRVSKAWPYKQADLKLYVDSLHKAGLQSEYSVIDLMEVAMRNIELNKTIFYRTLYYAAFITFLLVTANGCAGLVTAASKGDAGTVQSLLKSGTPVDQIGPNGLTALNWAVMGNHVEVVKILVDNGANLNHSTSIGFSPLHGAARDNRVEIARILIDAGADLERKVYSGTWKGWTPLKFAQAQGNTEIEKMLIDAGAKRVTAYKITKKRDRQSTIPYQSPSTFTQSQKTTVQPKGVSHLQQLKRNIYRVNP